jgi:hypothetical protein
MRPGILTLLSRSVGGLLRPAGTLSRKGTPPRVLKGCGSKASQVHTEADWLDGAVEYALVTNYQPQNPKAVGLWLQP